MPCCFDSSALFTSFNHCLSLYACVPHIMFVIAGVTHFITCLHFVKLYCFNESTAGADASVEASYNVASKKKPGDRSSDS